MKKLIIGCFVLFLSTIVFAQEKTEPPVWNIGDKWIYTGHPGMVVVKEDDSSYTVKSLTKTGEFFYVYDKPSLNILYSIEKDKQIPYKGVDKRVLNFPLSTGKTWKDTYSTTVYRGNIRFPQEYSYIQSYAVLGWEDVEVKAGKFKSLKIGVKYERLQEITGSPKEGKAWVWYSPDVKNLIKWQFEVGFWAGYDEWELTSFKLKK
jgi:hypothetical protein